MRFKIEPGLLEDVRILAPTQEIFKDIMTVFTSLKMKHSGNVLPLNKLYLWDIQRENTTTGFFYGKITMGNIRTSTSAGRRIMNLEQFIAQFVDMSPDTPGAGKPYWYIDTTKRVSKKAVWEGSEIDTLRLAFWNVFHRRGEALKKLESL